jgi:serine/threonine-protein kinase
VSEFAKLTDFGIAKIIDAPAITFSEQRFGTVGYIAPEYIEGQPATALGDIYALGVCLYQMVTGALPFESKVSADLLALALKGDPVKPSARVRDLPSGLEDLILRMIARRPEDRPRDAFAVHDALDVVMKRLRGPAVRVEPTPVAPLSLPLSTQRDGRVPFDVEHEREPRSARGEGVDLTATVIDRGPQSVSPRSWLAEELIARPVAELGERWHKTLADLERHIERSAQVRGKEQGVARARELAESARGLIAALERAKAVAATHQAQVDALEERGRVFRTTLGHAIDALSRDRSRELAHLEAIAALRGGIQEELQAIRARGGTDAKQKEALVWEAAAVGAEETRARAVDADLAYQVETLQQQLEAQNGEIEAELADATGKLEGGLAAVRRITGELVRTMADAANCL